MSETSLLKKLYHIFEYACVIFMISIFIIFSLQFFLNGIATIPFLVVVLLLIFSLFFSDSFLVWWGHVK